MPSTLVGTTRYLLGISLHCFAFPACTSNARGMHVPETDNYVGRRIATNARDLHLFFLVGAVLLLESSCFIFHC